MKRGPPFFQMRARGAGVVVACFLDDHYWKYVPQIPLSVAIKV